MSVNEIENRFEITNAVKDIAENSTVIEELGNETFNVSESIADLLNLKLNDINIMVNNAETVNKKMQFFKTSSNTN